MNIIGTGNDDFYSFTEAKNSQASNPTNGGPKAVFVSFMFWKLLEMDMALDMALWTLYDSRLF